MAYTDLYMIRSSEARAVFLRHDRAEDDLNSEALKHKPRRFQLTTLHELTVEWRAPLQPRVRAIPLTQDRPLVYVCCRQVSLIDYDRNHLVVLTRVQAVLAVDCQLTRFRSGESGSRG